MHMTNLGLIRTFHHRLVSCFNFQSIFVIFPQRGVIFAKVFSRLGPFYCRFHRGRGLGRDSEAND